MQFCANDAAYVRDRVLLLIADCSNNYYNKRKFKNVKSKTHLKTIELNWGKPKVSFIHSNLDTTIVYKYKKDFLSWETYIFFFDTKDSLLKRKVIDD